MARPMATMTIRNIDPTMKEKLRLQAARHGHSMEAEVRAILRSALGRPDRQETLAGIMGELFGPGNGVELDLPRREPEREPPVFE